MATTFATGIGEAPAADSTGSASIKKTATGIGLVLVEGAGAARNTTSRATGTGVVPAINGTGQTQQILDASGTGTVSVNGAGVGTVYITQASGTGTVTITSTGLASPIRNAEGIGFISAIQGTGQATAIAPLTASGVGILQMFGFDRTTAAAPGGLNSRNLGTAAAKVRSFAKHQAWVSLRDGDIHGATHGAAVYGSNVAVGGDSGRIVVVDYAPEDRLRVLHKTDFLEGPIKALESTNRFVLCITGRVVDETSVPILWVFDNLLSLPLRHRIELGKGADPRLLLVDEILDRVVTSGGGGCIAVRDLDAPGTIVAQAPFDAYAPVAGFFQERPDIARPAAQPLSLMDWFGGSNLTPNPGAAQPSENPFGTARRRIRLDPPSESFHRIFFMDPASIYRRRLQIKLRYRWITRGPRDGQIDFFISTDGTVPSIPSDPAAAIVVQRQMVRDPRWREDIFYVDDVPDSVGDSYTIGVAMVGASTGRVELELAQMELNPISEASERVALIHIFDETSAKLTVGELRRVRESRGLDGEDIVTTDLLRVVARVDAPHVEGPVSVRDFPRVSWDDGAAHTSEDFSTVPGFQTVVPRVDVVLNRATGHYLVYWGYENPNDYVVFQPHVLDENTGGPSGRDNEIEIDEAPSTQRTFQSRLPEIFWPGDHSFVAYTDTDGWVRIGWDLEFGAPNNFEERFSIRLDENVDKVQVGGGLDPSSFELVTVYMEKLQRVQTWNFVDPLTPVLVSDDRITAVSPIGDVGVLPPGAAGVSGPLHSRDPNSTLEAAHDTAGDQGIPWWSARSGAVRIPGGYLTVHGAVGRVGRVLFDELEVELNSRRQL